MTDKQAWAGWTRKVKEKDAVEEKYRGAQKIKSRAWGGFGDAIDLRAAAFHFFLSKRINEATEYLWRHHAAATAVRPHFLPPEGRGWFIRFARFSRPRKTHRRETLGWYSQNPGFDRRTTRSSCVLPYFSHETLIDLFCIESLWNDVTDNLFSFFF